MSKSAAPSVIRLRGVRHNNLKNFDLDLPLRKLIVITGLSGSGKSSLAFDTLFAEGQRRYIETFSPYARQFFDRMDKPQVDSIEGIPPAIAIEQRNAVRTTRSTVGTMTELCDFMKMLWPHIAQLHCRQCGQLVRKDSPQMIWQALRRGASIEDPGIVKAASETQPSTLNSQSEVLITFDLPLTEKLSLDESLALIAKQGYQRLLIDSEIQRIDQLPSRIANHESRITSLTVIQDRLKLTADKRARFIEACEQAYHFGKGKLAIHDLPSANHAPVLRSAIDGGGSRIIHRFSNRLHCAHCDIEYPEPSPGLFSFNNPVGACPTCRGFGRNITIDYNRAVPDRSKTVAGGLIRPWQVGHGLESQNDLMKMCRHFEIPTNVPFEKLARKWQNFVIEGDPEYGKDEEHEWPRAWYGVKGYFRWLESKAYKMHVRVLLSRYRAYTTCPDCQGKRFQPAALLYLASGSIDVPPGSAGILAGVAQPDATRRQGCRRSQALTLADFYQLPIRDAAKFIESLAQNRPARPNDALNLLFNEVQSRLGYLNEVGLGYLTLDRPTRSLSGGETERVSLTTCLGTRLVNTLFVLDEPSVGLHQRDIDRLVRILVQLRDAGNTVVVVEHEASVMRAADQIVDLGPGHGATGGEVVFQGSYGEILRSSESLTGQYLSGRQQIEIPERRPVEAIAYGSARYTWKDSSVGALALNDAPSQSANGRRHPAKLRLAHVTRNNLEDLSIEIPLRRFVCVTGVSGSGKTTLIREALLPALQAKLEAMNHDAKASDRMSSEESDDDKSEIPSASARQSLVLEGWETLGQVILVDQTILGRTPRSNPAVYIGAFDDIRAFYAQSEPARQRGLNESSFSFNSPQGQCERCRGAGFEKIEMQFLSDVFIRCPDCNGRRYRRHILEVKVSPKSKVQGPKSGSRRVTGALVPEPGDRQLSTRTFQHASRPLSIADLLDSTVEEAIAFLASFPDSRPARAAVKSLGLLAEVGLGYLKLGQPINTLSGGESQRLKLVRHLADSDAGIARSESLIPSNPHRATATNKGEPASSSRYPASSIHSASTLFLFDEPTTGLHFEDVRVLLKVFQRLVDAGHSVLVIEHNLDVIKSADWLIDLGPDAGDQGGQLVAEGTPEQVAACPGSHTGQALREVLQGRRSFQSVLSV